MKKILAALTAVTLAAGLSLVAAVGPALADTTATPNPVPSSSTTPSSTPSTTPSSTPSTAPSSTPSATPTPVPTDGTGSTTTDTTKPAPTAREFTATRIQNGDGGDGNNNTPPATTYVTVVWSMPTWNSVTAATYPQTLYSETKESTETLSVSYPSTCGTQFQIDSYIDTPAFETWIAKYLPTAHPAQILLAGPDGAQDGTYLAPGGRDVAYKLVENTSPTCTWPCISDSSVSYTYNSTSNSGDITVPQNPDGSNGVLCKPFYVTATSWTYDGAGTWPQTVDVVDHVNGAPTGGNNVQILNSGVYHFAATVTCGQGDIYASWTSNDGTLFPENDNLPGVGILNGPGTPLHEHFLHDMGFSGPNPTYTQQGTNCFTTPPPTFKYVSCKADTSNTITLPAVLGGKWTVTDGTNTYTTTTGQGLSAFTPIGYAQYTITLTDGDSGDSYTVPTSTYHYTATDLSGLDCNQLANPIKPTPSYITACGVTGSLDVTPVKGVDYYINGTQYTAGLTILDASLVNNLSGTVPVVAKAETGYEFDTTTHSTETDWSFDLGSTSTCTFETSFGDCVAVVGGPSTESVTMTFTNPGADDATFVVTGGSNNVDLTFIVPGGTTSAPQVIDSLAESGSPFHVSINGGTAQDVAIDFTGCIPTGIPADPTVTQEVCNVATGTLSGTTSLTVDLEPGLVYSISGPNGFSLTNLTPASNGGASGPWVAATGIDAGDYYVTVVAADGYTLDSSLTSPTWPFHLNLATPDCSFSVSVTPASCSSDPEIPSSGTVSKVTTAAKFSSTLENYGTITVQLNPDVVYTAVLQSAPFTQTVLDDPSGTTIMPDGKYVVNVTLSAQGVTDGYVLSPSPRVFEAEGGVPFDLTADCFPVLPTFNAGASATDGTCTATSSTQGTIDLTHALDQTGDVIYTIKDASNHTVYSGTNSIAGDTLVSVGAGTYTVTATPTDGTSGLSGNGSTSGNSMVFSALVVTIDGTGCGLAFTGGTIAWLGFVLAGGMLFLGFALLLMRRRGNRTA